MRQAHGAESGRAWRRRGDGRNFAGPKFAEMPVTARSGGYRLVCGTGRARVPTLACCVTSVHETGPNAHVPRRSCP